jgi:hypothetical protein
MSMDMALCEEITADEYLELKIKEGNDMGLKEIQEWQNKLARKASEVSYSIGSYESKMDVAIEALRERFPDMDWEDVANVDFDTLIAQAKEEADGIGEDIDEMLTSLEERVQEAHERLRATA